MSTDRPPAARSWPPATATCRSQTNSSLSAVGTPTGKRKGFTDETAAVTHTHTQSGLPCSSVTQCGRRQRGQKRYSRAVWTREMLQHSHDMRLRCHRSTHAQAHALFRLHHKAPFTQSGSRCGRIQPLAFRCNGRVTAHLSTAE